MNNKILYRKEIELLELAKTYIGKCQGFINNVRDAIPDLFYENSFNLKREFIELIPTAELSKTRSLLDFLKSVSADSGSAFWTSNISKTYSELRSSISNLITLMQTQINIQAKYKIFYSWQSDIESKFNRNFIESALEKAIKEISQEKGVTLILDTDTREKSGSPDIVNSILEKIDDSMMVVADVTLIDKYATKNKGISNSNVMFELGYSISSLSDKRVVMVCNTAYGSTNELPFDLGLKRQITYSYNGETSPENKAQEKENLTKKIKNAIISILNL